MNDSRVTVTVLPAKTEKKAWQDLRFELLGVPFLATMGDATGVCWSFGGGLLMVDETGIRHWDLAYLTSHPESFTFDRLVDVELVVR